MSKWWHTLATIGMLAVAVVTPSVQSAVSGHVLITGVLTSAWSILGHILASPTGATVVQ
jgi:hypothetical protein